MSSYYPLPNNYELSNNDDLVIKSSLTVFNYPNNSLLKNVDKHKKNIFFYIYYLINKKWKKCEQKICKFGEKLEIKREDLSIPEDAFAVVVPSFNNNSPDETSILIKPSSTRSDKCPVAERASYNFSLKNLTTSYQGEFPFSLANLKKSSFFSFDALRVDGLQNSETYLILINLDREAKNLNSNKLNFYLAKSRKIIKEVDVKTNSCEYIKLPKFHDHNDSHYEPIFISCSSSTFIPLYLTINLEPDNLEICIEHTHPPSEIFWGDQKYKFLKILKSNWIK